MDFQLGTQEVGFYRWVGPLFRPWPRPVLVHLEDGVDFQLEAEEGGTECRRKE